MKTRLLAVILCCSAVVVCVEAFCKREWDWKRKSEEERAVDADIVVYARVAESPCLKPKPVAPTDKEDSVSKKENGTITQNNTSSSNQTANITTTTEPPTSTTASPSTVSISRSTFNKINCSAETYNVTLEVFCVIKGGAVSQFIHVDGFGIDENNCLNEESMNDTVDEYHAYNMQNYTIFLGRKENQQDGQHAFWLHRINDQPASTEVVNVSKSLMKVAGRHAHAPVGVWKNKTHPSCVPYSAASALSFPSHVALAASSVAMFLKFFFSKSF